MYIKLSSWLLVLLYSLNFLTFDSKDKETLVVNVLILMDLWVHPKFRSLHLFENKDLMYIEKSIKVVFLKHIVIKQLSYFSYHLIYLRLEMSFISDIDHWYFEFRHRKHLFSVYFGFLRQFVIVSYFKKKICYCKTVLIIL